LPSLVYFVVPETLGHTAVQEKRNANVAPIAIAESVKILNSSCNNHRQIVACDVVHFFLRERVLALEREISASAECGPIGIIGEWRRNSRWNDHFALLRLGEYLIAKTKEPSLHFVIGVRPGKNPSLYSGLQSWRFSIVNHVHVNEHKLIGLNVEFMFNVVLPHVGPLIQFQSLFGDVGLFPEKVIRRDVGNQNERRRRRMS
jgi:hypothetical protein